MQRRHPCWLAKTCLAVLVIALGACSPKEELLLQGRTMGTTYHITVVARSVDPVARLKAPIDQRLDEINQSMSTFQPDSEISRFNNQQEKGSTLPVSADFAQVMRVGAELYRLTNGAWDGTVDPLVNLWGFGRKGEASQVPGAAQIKAALERVGFDAIRVTDQRSLVKEKAGVSLDLASIAKGYAVDQVARLIGDKGYKDFLVEIGGEVFAAGTRADGKPWRVGINRPSRDAGLREVYRVVALSERAFATSGDYRNFLALEGHYYSHIIDPRSGRPVDNHVVSASVVADDCTFADGLATALMVMGPAAGVELVNRLKGVECLVVVGHKDGSLTDYPSAGFKKLLVNLP